MASDPTPSSVEASGWSGRLLSLPSDVLLYGLLADPDRLKAEDDPLAAARRLPPAPRYRWVKSLDPRTKSELIARYLYGVV